MKIKQIDYRCFVEELKCLPINYPAASERGKKTIFSPLSGADFNNAASRMEFDPQRLTTFTVSNHDAQIDMAIAFLNPILEKMRTNAKSKITLEISELLKNDLDNPAFSAVSLYGPLEYGRLEVAHSNTLAWLLNPKAEHGFGTLLLESFFSHVSGSMDTIMLDVKYITSEYYTKKGFRIDIWTEGNLKRVDTSESVPWLMVIECKIDHYETDNQLKKYEEEISIWEKNNNKGEVYRIFLTEGKDEAETGEMYWTPISFEDLFTSFWKQSKYLKNKPGYQFFRLYLTGVLKDIMGWTLPLDSTTDSPYEALLLLDRLNGRTQ